MTKKIIWPMVGMTNKEKLMWLMNKYQNPEPATVYQVFKFHKGAGEVDDIEGVFSTYDKARAHADERERTYTVGYEAVIFPVTVDDKSPYDLQKGLDWMDANEKKAR